MATAVDGWGSDTGGSAFPAPALDFFGRHNVQRFGGRPMPGTYVNMRRHFSQMMLRRCRRASLSAWYAASSCFASVMADCSRIARRSFAAW